MKTYFLSFLFLFLVFACGGNQDRNSVGKPEDALSEKYAEIQFDQESHDFGKVNEGEHVGWYFYFTNKGNTDLLIVNAHASCGCTVPEYDKKPVAPGERGFVKVIFDTFGYSGIQYKSVSIESNAKNNTVKLSLSADIIN